MTAGLADALLADRYRLLEQIAVGGMGEVWRAQDLLLDRLVAVKTLRPEHLGDEDFRARFRAEARHAGGLSHPGIASVFDFGEDDDRAWLVMELVDGEPLSTLLRREGVLSVDRTLDLVAQTADALHAAHAGGVVHRDVKPGNLLVRPDGVLKVTDFGIASAVDAMPLTQTGLVVGTAYYLSPEQASGRSGSPASDVYGLGVVAYECLAGVRPFRGENPIAVALAHLREQPEPLPASVPVLVAELVARAMEKRPEDRFPDAAAMAGTSRQLRAGLADGVEHETGRSVGGLAALPVRPPAGVTAATGQLELPEPRHAPGSRSRSARSAVRLVLALLVVLSLGLGARTLLTAPAGGSATPATPDGPDAVTLQQDPDVVVDAAAYAGLPAVDVRAALAELGLVPRLAYDGSGTPVGTVSGVDPVGALPVGSEVVLHVVPEPAPVAPAPVVPAPAAPAPVAPEPVAPAPVAPAPVEPAPAQPAPAAPESPLDPPSGPGRGSAGGHLTPLPGRAGAGQIVTAPGRPRLLGGRYELGAAIGSGGMAEVFRGVDVRLGRDVAIKVLRPDLARDPSFQGRFRREAQSAASLSARSIVSVFDTGEDEAGVPYIVMELVDGRTLREVLLTEGRLLPQRALEVAAEICAALATAHAAGIVHRDIKPANVMLTRSGQLKVMDFGIARAASDASSAMTQTAAVIGTAAYLSPEQARGEHVDARSDLYSTGCLLYELVTGAPPFTGDSPVAVAYQHVREDPEPPSAYDEELSPEIDAVVLKAMAKNPANRYQSAQEMREDLLRATAGEAVLATPILGAAAVVTPAAVVHTQRADGGRRARRSVAYGLFGLLLVALLIGTALLVRGLLATDQGLVPAPALVGLSQSAALAELRANGLTVGDVNPVFSDRPFGTVLAQSPAADILLRSGGAVQLTVSRGIEQVIVPVEVVGLSRDEADVLLAERELTVVDVVTRDGNIPAGTVLAISPQPGTQVAAGSEVVLTVASGNVQVPDVRGRALDEATAELQRAGFSVGIEPRTDPGAPDLVLDQSPVNSLAGRGTAVVIVVSTTPPPPPPPSPSPTPEPSPTAEPGADAPEPSVDAVPSPTG